MFCVEHSSLKALLFGTTAEMVAEQHKGNSTGLKGSGFAEQLEPQCIGCYCGVRGGEGEGGGGVKGRCYNPFVITKKHPCGKTVETTLPVRGQEEFSKRYASKSSLTSLHLSTEVTSILPNQQAREKVLGLEILDRKVTNMQTWLQEKLGLETKCYM